MAWKKPDLSKLKEVAQAGNEAVKKVEEDSQKRVEAMVQSLSGKKPK